MVSRRLGATRAAEQGSVPSLPDSVNSAGGSGIGLQLDASRQSGVASSLIWLDWPARFVLLVEQ